jgi:hypothetical protein
VIPVLIIAIVMGVIIAVLLFLLGFKLGNERGQSRIARVHLDAARAERQLHDLTREAFVAMAEASQRRRQ